MKKFAVLIIYIVLFLCSIPKVVSQEVYTCYDVTISINQISEGKLSLSITNTADYVIYVQLFFNKQIYMNHWFPTGGSTYNFEMNLEQGKNSLLFSFWKCWGVNTPHHVYLGNFKYLTNN